MSVGASAIYGVWWLTGVFAFGGVVDGLRWNSNAAALLAEHFKTDFVLVDVGCSGGIAPGWRSLGEHLAAVGFDTALDEIYRLRAAEVSPKIRYFSGFIGVPPSHPLARLSKRYSYWRRNPWNHLAVVLGMKRDHAQSGSPLAEITDYRDAEKTEALKSRFSSSQLLGWKREKTKTAGVNIGIGQAAAQSEAALMERNEWNKTARTDEKHPILLEQALGAAGVANFDMLKIDVDGPDFEILQSSAHLLNGRSVLGAALEVNFFGSAAPIHNTFHNTDRLMRSLGFSLFGLTTRAYSNAALPSPFAQAYPAQSLRGRPFQGDAIYLRDFSLKVAGGEAETFGPDSYLKLAAIFALINLPDEAACLLLRFKSVLEDEGVPVDRILDDLAYQAQPDRPEPWNYQEYIEAFLRNDPWFYGRSQEGVPGLEALATAQG